MSTGTLTPEQAGNYLATLLNARGKSWNYWRNKAVKSGFLFDMAKKELSVEGSRFYYSKQGIERMASYLKDNGLVVITKNQTA